MVYLFALVDWHSRYIVGWKLAITMEVEHGIEAFRERAGIESSLVCRESGIESDTILME